MNGRSNVAAMVLVALLTMPAMASAAFIDFTDVIPGGDNRLRIDDGMFSFGGLDVSAMEGSSLVGLTIADFGSEVGVGVCGAGDSVSGTLCKSSSTNTGWNGQYDEIENHQGTDEYVRILENGSELLGAFKVGSFDNTEAGYVSVFDDSGLFGTVNFRRTTTGPGAEILQETGSITGSSIFHAVSDPSEVWTLVIGGFVESISRVEFHAGCGTVSTCTSTDNDYLVAAADAGPEFTTPVPIPAAAWLFVSALGVFGFLGKRARQF